VGVLAAAIARGEPAPRPIAIPLGATPGRAGEAVRAWMAERLPAFGLEDSVDALIVEREEPLPAGGSRVLVQQLWHGLPVVGGDARAIVSPEGALTSLVSGFVRVLSAPLSPGITPAVASGLAARAAGLPSDAAMGTVTLSVSRRADGDHLVWEVSHRRPDGEPVRGEVDAVTGEVLEADAGVTHAVGRVYPTDPSGPLQELELFRMEPGTPLHSAAFDIEDQIAPPVVPVVPGDYRLQPTDPGFDQVNLYWHVDHYLNDFLRALGYAGPPTPLVVRLHADMNPWPALATENYVTFGLPIPGFTLESSRSHDIIYHELTHTVIYGFGIQPDGTNAEPGALHEGIADYFAAAFTGDPVIGEWLYISFTNQPGMTRIDQPNPPWNYAHYNQVAYNGGAAGTTHGNGMILSSALWDLRRQIGSTCDSLVLESLAYLPSRPVWAQFANALIAADLDHHAGREWVTVGDAMRARGIHGAVAASISGPSALSPGESGTFAALPCCGGAPGTYHWRARNMCRGLPCGPWRDLGVGDSLHAAFLNDTQLELSAVSAFGDSDGALLPVSVTAPFVDIEGPRSVAQNHVGTWTARVAVASPFRLTWHRQWLEPPATPEVMGTAQSVSFPVKGRFSLSVELQDAVGRSATQEIEVGSYDDRLLVRQHDMVQLSQFVTGGRQAETHVELAAPAMLRVSVYDLHGRERLQLFDDSEPRGERVIRWDASVLEPGIYYVHATTSIDKSATLRFIVLR
jgi:hypothetical protein